MLNERAWFLLTSVEISILGGICNWLLSDEKKWVQLFVNIFIAGFVGLLVGELCLHYQLSEPWSYFIAGSSGLSAESLLLLFRRNVILRLESLLQDEKTKEELVKAQLGELLTSKFGVNAADINDAINKQQLGKLKIGEILVSEGIITQETLRSALQEQGEVFEKIKKEQKRKRKKPSSQEC